MKAKDLAALAALGIAGKYAYDKYSEKNAPAKKGGGEDYSNEGRSAKFADEDYSNEGRGKEAPDYSNEGRGKAAPDYSNEGRGKVAPDFSNEGKGKGKAPVKKAAAVSSSSESKGGPSRYRPAADSQDASTSFRNQEEAMAAYVPRRTPAAAASPTFSSSEEGMQSYVPRRTPGAADGVGSTFSSSAEGMENYVPRRVAPAATFSSTEEGMQNYAPRRPGQAPVASSTAAGMAAYVPRNTAATAQAKLDALRSSGGRRAKGGAIKMASGGLASSKMSKPSGASRGDGIAQRGRTRGKYL